MELWGSCIRRHWKGNYLYRFPTLIDFQIMNKAFARPEFYACSNAKRLQETRNYYAWALDDDAGGFSVIFAGFGSCTFKDRH